MRWTMMVFLFLVLAGGVLGEVRNVTGGLNVSLTGGVGNVSYSGGEFGFNASENFTIERLVVLPVSFPDVVNASVNLSSGESRVLEGYYDDLSLSCAGSSSGVCSINASVGWGETYTSTSGACNVRMKCDQAVGVSNQTFNATRTVTIRKSGSDFVIELENRSETVSAGVLNASMEIPVNFICPLTPFDQLTEEDARISYEMCSVYFPLVNDWLNLSLNRCFDNFDAYRDFVKTHDEFLISSNQELSNQIAQVGVLKGEAEALKGQIVTLQDGLNERDGTLDVLVIISSVLTMTVVALSILSAVLWGQANRGGG